MLSRGLAVCMRTMMLTAGMVLLAPLPLSAVIVENLFEVEIRVPDESREIRRVAMADGLAEVLVRVSGDSEILQKIQPSGASAYVKQFRYTRLETVPGSEPEDANATAYTLWVQYNGTRIMELLRQRSIPIWSEHRSQAVIWLAVRDGSNRYILKQQDASLLKDSAEAAFVRRGIPVVWPRHDSTDRQQLRFADVWAGFAGPLQSASKRYSSGPVVAASMTWNGQKWLADWSLFVDSESWRWRFADSDYNAVIVHAIDRIADAMAMKYAVLETTDASALEVIEVTIDDVRSVTGFRQVQDYLAGLSAVQSLSLLQLDPERVTFRLRLRSNVTEFLNLVKVDKTLTRLPGAMPVDRPVEVPVDASVNGPANVPMNGPVYRFRKYN